VVFSPTTFYTCLTTKRRENHMSLGNSLFHARKKCGLSQEEVAERLGVSRQTVSKWETDETLPDIRQSKKMAVLYNLSLDELIDFDLDVREIQQAIERTSEEVEEKIDWTSAWGKKYPILLTYQKEVNTPNYAVRLGAMIDELRAEYGYSEMDAFLVLKDILAKVWKERKK
jgi:transcriptional regulator with XRE-family HTH domain